VYVHRWCGRDVYVHSWCGRDVYVHRCCGRNVYVHRCCVLVNEEAVMLIAAWVLCVCGRLRWSGLLTETESCVSVVDSCARTSWSPTHTYWSFTGQLWFWQKPALLVWRLLTAARPDEWSVEVQCDKCTLAFDANSWQISTSTKVCSVTSACPCHHYHRRHHHFTIIVII